MIKKSDFTLIVPSRAYRERWDGDNRPSEGAGAAREINVLKGRFDKNQKSLRSRTIIIIMPGITKADVPDEIYSYLQRFRVNPKTNEGVELLLRRLTKQPEFVLPNRGAVPDLPPRPRAIPGDRVQSSRHDETKSATAGTTTWLPAAKKQRDEVSRLVQDVENASPPPFRPSEEDELDEWLATLANWTDDTSSLVDEIEQVRSLVPKDPSIRFVRALSKVRTTIQSILDDLDGPRTIASANSLADSAAEVCELVKQLARLSLEP